jgi:hypothetical protein
MNRLSIGEIFEACSMKRMSSDCSLDIPFIEQASNKWALFLNAPHFYLSP